LPCVLVSVPTRRSSDLEGGVASSTFTSYTYNSRQYVCRIEKSTSGSGILRLETTYPFDYPSMAVLSQMTRPEINMLDYPVEKIQDRMSTRLNSRHVTIS